MMSGSSKGLPIKVPTIPIKVITSNASQVSLKVSFIHQVCAKAKSKTCFDSGDSGDFLTQQMDIMPMRSFHS